jgi:hypothetical protein
MADPYPPLSSLSTVDRLKQRRLAAIKSRAPTDVTPTPPGRGKISGKQSSKVLANVAKAYEIAGMAERVQLEQMTDEELLRIIAMGENGADIAKQVSGLLTIVPR